MNSDVKMDEEGYIIPPHLIAAQNSSEGRTSSKRKEHDRFYSDSDSSDDDEDIKKPIHVIIKPINGSQGLKQTGSIAELKETVKGLSISPSLLPSVSFIEEFIDVLCSCRLCSRLDILSCLSLIRSHGVILTR